MVDHTPDTTPIGNRVAARCTAKSKTTQERCLKAAAFGTNVCQIHGARAPQTKAKAQRAAVEEKARKTFGRLADHSTPVADPLTALGQLAGHVTAWMEFLSGQVADLEELRFEDVKGSEQIDGRVQLFRQALVDCNQVLGTYARLGIDDRLARISERQAETVLKAIEVALEAVGVPSERRPNARRAAARHLRSV